MAIGPVRIGAPRMRRSTGSTTTRLTMSGPTKRTRSVWRTGTLIGVLMLSLVAPLLSFPAPAPQPAAAAPISGAASRIGEGVYSVYATREGLVGGYTSSGHKIVAHDYFVSLPSCTTTSCPGGATRGIMTNCGSRCYVKVVNPRTNACRVEPIYDIGPWFRVDDWWNPTAQRYLNTLRSNPNDLAQGYTGSEAARRGLDVGYGIGPHGFGYDDTGTTPSRPWREVGNRAAIDLADGTWYDLRLSSDGTGADVTVHMLWQTGADPAAQAQACGHPLNQRPQTNPPGLPNPSFRGFKAQITNSFDNPATGNAPGAHDSDSNTTWFSGRDYKPRATLTVDLGALYDISGVKWKFHTLGLADQFAVSVTNETGGSRGLGVFGNAPYAQSFYGVATSDPVHARFIVFSFTNPTNDVSLGSISELEVWARSLAPTSSGGTTPGALNPSFAGFKAGIVYSGDSPYTGSSFASYDNNLNTTWFSGRDYKPQASLTVDLGATYDLTGIRWKFHTLGLADRFTVAVVNEAGQTRTLGLFGNASYPQTFYGVGISDLVYARYVVFSFTNIGNDASLGSISELEVWARGYINPSTISSAAAEPTATPSVTPTPTQTATPTEEPTAEDSREAAPDVDVPDGATPAPTDAIAGDTSVQQTPGSVETEVPGEPTTPAPPIATDDDTGSRGYIAFTDGDGAFCRTLPDTAGAVIALVPEGTELVLTGETIDGWQPVICEGRAGYVLADFVSEDTPPPPEPTESPEPSVTPTEATAPDESPAGEEPEATAEPTLALAPESELVQREIIIVSGADTSVTALDPDSPQPSAASDALAAGGDMGAVAVVSFEIAGVAGGDVVSAQLVLTGAGDTSGVGGEVIAIPGVWFDETSTTWNSVGEAERAGGLGAGRVGWIQPGMESTVDVTGVVAGDSLVSFLILGTPGGIVAIGSGEGTAPAYLVLTVDDGSAP